MNEKTAFLGDKWWIISVISRISMIKNKIFFENDVQRGQRPNKIIIQLQLGLEITLFCKSIFSLLLIKSWYTLPFLVGYDYTHKDFRWLNCTKINKQLTFYNRLLSNLSKIIRPSCILMFTNKPVSTVESTKDYTILVILTKSTLVIISYNLVKCWLVGFYGISTLHGYLMPMFIYIYIYIYIFANE